VRADELATEAIKKQKQTRQAPKLIPLVQTSVYLIQGKATLTSLEVRALRSSLPTKNIKKYLHRRHIWDEKIFKSIAWDAYASAIRSIDANMQQICCKVCNNWLPVSQRLIKYGNTYDLFLCRQQWRDSFLSSLCEEMKKWHTAADNRREIVTGLQHGSNIQTIRWKQQQQQQRKTQMK
jgi:hypothetical protein